MWNLRRSHPRKEGTAMTVDQMKRGLELLNAANRLRKQLDEFVLLQRDSFTKEVVCLGDPVSYKSGEYHRVEIPLSDQLRRYAFRIWRQEQTLRYNSIVRELNQLGVTSDHEPRIKPEAKP